MATYKSKHPDALTSLQDARTILSALKPDTSSDAETVGLWGAIHKRLWEAGGDPSDLDKAIRSYARGYFLRDDYYNGINFAFLLNVRAATAQGDEAIADRVLARRIRAEVLTLCDAALNQGRSAVAEWLSSRTLNQEDLFWIRATKVEALLGLGRTAEADALRTSMVETEPRPAQWSVDSMMAQLKALAALEP